MPTDYISLQKAVDAGSAALVAEEVRHSEAMRKLQAELVDALKARNEANAGLDSAAITLAQTVLSVTGDASKVVNGAYEGREGVRDKAVEDAIFWFTHLDDDQKPRTDLRTRTIGVKNYDGFGDQREDHEYGRGPRHGSIVFRIALQRNVKDEPLTAEQRNACIYYLRNLKAIQAAEMSAKSEAA